MALMSISLYSKCLARTVPLRALVPVDEMNLPADEPVKPLRALYLLGGMFGSENDWLTYTRIALTARRLGLALFCPAGENSFYTAQYGTGLDWLRFIGEELPAVTRQLFPLSARREDTFIGGLSMGGYGALNAGLSYPQTFGGVFALSAVIHPWTMMNAPEGSPVLRPTYAEAVFGPADKRRELLDLAKNCVQKAPPIWMACGTEDALYPDNQRFVDRAAALGLDVTWKAAPGGHGWDFWDRESVPALEWLTREKPQ